MYASGVPNEGKPMAIPCDGMPARNQTKRGWVEDHPQRPGYYLSALWSVNVLRLVRDTAALRASGKFTERGGTL